MLVVAGHLMVSPDRLVDPGRIDVFEHGESQADVDAFRGGGPSDEQGRAILSGSVGEYDVREVRELL